MSSSSSHSLSLTPLGIVPEKAVLTHQLRRTVAAQYWGLAVASSAAPDAALASSVSDPAPLPLMAGSGLSRPHLVMATQAVKLPGRPSLPGLPSVCHDQGGVVLDRILAYTSGDSWWAALTGRARLGRLVARRSDLVVAAADPASYSVCGTSRVQLSRSTVLRSRLDWCSPIPVSAANTSSASGPGRRRAQRDAAPAPGSGDAAAASDGQAPAAGPTGWAAPLSLSSQLQSRVGRWAEARADLAVCHRAACSAVAPSGNGAVGAGGVGGGGGAGVTTPLLMGLQAGSVATSRAPLVWRCGVLQVTAPPTVPLRNSEGAAAAAGAIAGPALQSAVYVQGTVALQKERVLWRGPKRPLRRRGRPEAAPAAAAADGLITAGGAGAGGVPAATMPPPAASAQAAPLIAARKAASYSLSRSSGDEDGDEDDEDVSIGSAGSGPAAAGKARPTGAGSGAAAGDAVATGGGGGIGGSVPPFSISLPSAGAVQEALVDATQSFSRLRDDVTAATQWVGGGGLVEQLDAVAAATPGAAPKRQAAATPRPRLDGAAAMPIPWSSFVGDPHVRVAGVAGVTARTPVIVLTHGSVPAPGGGGGSSLLPTRLAWVQDLGLKHVLRRRRGRDGADGDGDGTRGYGCVAAEGGDAAGPAVRRGALRPFASAAASVQAGRFSGWLLDFTRVSAQLDCGLWGPAAAGQSGAAPGGQRHPAFALGDTGAWHALSLSLSQQLVGPLRFAADWRYHLASTRPLSLPPPPPASPAGSTAAAAAGSWLGDAAVAVAAHTVRMRPQLMDAVYALDLAVPGSRGAARLVAWYAPQRREGMVELRMF